MIYGDWMSENLYKIPKRQVKLVVISQIFLMIFTYGRIYNPAFNTSIDPSTIYFLNINLLKIE